MVPEAPGPFVLLLECVPQVSRGLAASWATTVPLCRGPVSALRVTPVVAVVPMATKGTHGASARRLVNFRIHYDTAFGESVVVVGSAPELGSWRLDAGFPLRFESGWWVGQASIAVPRARTKGSPPPHKVLYKYALVNAAAPTQWEHGNDRTLLLAGNADGDTVPLCYELRDVWRVRGCASRVCTQRQCL